MTKPGDGARGKPRDGDQDRDAAVRTQYETLPYPERDPGDEAKRLITGSPSHLLEIEHYVLAGRRAGALRVLVAGGGTGDAAIMLAQQLQDRGTGGEVHYLDLSQASTAIAQARATERGLKNIFFHNGSLLQLDAQELGRFDYIDCCGVLHHLEDPGAGLRALAQAVLPQGGLGIMLYGALGRTGVYPMQRALKRLTGKDTTTRRRLKDARKLLADLPESNWLRRNPHVSDHHEGGDAGLFDLLLHPRDRAYLVPEIHHMAAASGLRVSGFIEPARYDPLSYLQDAQLRRRAQGLPKPEQQALAEELAGNLKTHVFYLVPEASPLGRADYTDEDQVPVLKEHQGPQLAAALEKQPVLKANFDGNECRYNMPPGGPTLIALMDGERSLADIRAATGFSAGKFKRIFEEVFGILNGLNLLLLAGRR